MLKQKFYSYLALSLVCTATAGILFFTIKDKSPTIDEMVHLPSGYVYDRLHDYRFNPEHPALAKSLYALPLLGLDLRLPANYQDYVNGAVFDNDNWQIDRAFGEDFLFGSGNDPQLIFYWGRIVAIGITLLLVVGVFFTAKTMLGEWPAVVASFFVGLSPIVLGHGDLTNTDVAITLGFIITVLAMWNYVQHSTRRNLVLFAFAFSIMALFKFTFVIAVAIYVVLKLYNVFILRRKQRLIYFDLQNILIFSGIFACALLVVYGFKPDEIKYFFKGLKMVISHTSSGHTTYFLGQLSGKGWWYYFPIALVLKNTIPTLLLIIFGTINFIINFRKPSSIWFLAGIVYLLVAMYSKANLGVRHVLPAIVMFTIYASSIFSKDSFIKPKKILLVTGLILAAWQGYEVASNYPYYIAYFNPIISEQNKAHYMTDSNLDWGQDGKYIADFARKNNLKNVYLDYAWTPPRQFEIYGLNNYGSASDQLAGTPGNYLISASTLEVHKSGKYLWLQGYPKHYLFGGTVAWIEVK